MAAKTIIGGSNFAKCFEKKYYEKMEKHLCKNNIEKGSYVIKHHFSHVIQDVMAKDKLFQSILGKECWNIDVVNSKEEQLINPVETTLEYQMKINTNIDQETEKAQSYIQKLVPENEDTQKVFNHISNFSIQAMIEYSEEEGKSKYIPKPLKNFLGSCKKFHKKLYKNFNKKLLEDYEIPTIEQSDADVRNAQKKFYETLINNLIDDKKDEVDKENECSSADNLLEWIDNKLGEIEEMKIQSEKKNTQIFGELQKKLSNDLPLLNVFKKLSVNPEINGSKNGDGNNFGNPRNGEFQRNPMSGNFPTTFNNRQFGTMSKSWSYPSNQFQMAAAAQRQNENNTYPQYLPLNRPMLLPIIKNEDTSMETDDSEDSENEIETTITLSDDDEPHPKNPESVKDRQNIENGQKSPQRSHGQENGFNHKNEAKKEDEKRRRGRPATSDSPTHIRKRNQRRKRREEIRQPRGDGEHEQGGAKRTKTS